MDACALIAFLRDELGADVVTAILKCAKQGKAEICMNSINLLEVYYGCCSYFEGCCALGLLAA
ncbi:MAG: hypothetical protein FWD52_09580 [Candidatus Bathyarchaeota archaeon]|nr:hypothetical protein [Candidatus Termiticorpusculum sp.]